ncbi:MAG: hypothetical protein JNK35_09870, partial [Phycisphaerae bacterium]|nr:hypothetical protein [Phycisphaerae bacterium]
VAGIHVVNDAYNANPDSTLAALRAFAAINAAAPRRVVVLGDNLELGDAGPDAHREIGRAILALAGGRVIDLLVAVGPLAAIAADAVEAAAHAATGPRVVRFPDLDDGRDRAAAALLRPGDCVLLKGSRRVALERVVAALRASPEVQARVAAARHPAPASGATGDAP